MVALLRQGRSPELDYVAVVPDQARDPPVPWGASLREPLKLTDDPELNHGLVGFAPTVRITDAGPDPKASARTARTMHRPCPGLRSLVTLSASSREGASASSASFSVHRRLANCLRPGDRLHVARGCGGGVAVSVVRDGRLVVAVGALAGLPILGPEVSVRIPWELIEESVDVFRKRDPKFKLIPPVLLPLEIRVGEALRLTQAFSASIGPYTVSFLRPSQLTDPFHGTRSEECLAIVHEGVWPEKDYLVSAELLGGLGGIKVVGW